MVSPCHIAAKAEGETDRATCFQFISVRAPNGVKDKSTSRLVRSHAVKQALGRKRKCEQESRDNFRVTTSQAKPGRHVTRKHAKKISLPHLTVSTGTFDPFQSLAIDVSRFRALLGDYKARQAPEPVFSVAEELRFQSFSSVFRSGLVDAALVCAVMLSLAFEAGGGINTEYLGYRGRTISYVREKMSSPADAASEATIGAILLLAGVEARLGLTSQVQLHMGAVRSLLDICRSEGVHLNKGIKRAIFWQDLNSSILAGSSRIVDHTTFSELHWARESFSHHHFRLPSGFQRQSHLLTKEFVEVLKDLHALQCIRNMPPMANCAVTTMAYINNHIASIQSRLMSLPDLSPAMSSCRLAAYLCSVMLCCTVWCGLVIPSHISSRLLRELQSAQVKDSIVWSDHPDLLLWILYIGGAFAPPGTVRAEYVVLLRANSAFGLDSKGLSGSWPQVVRIMGSFIWSEKAFMSQVKALWKEVSAHV